MSTETRKIMSLQKLTVRLVLPIVTHLSGEITVKEGKSKKETDRTSADTRIIIALV